MSKPLKDVMTGEYASLYEGVEGACVVDLTGMDAGSLHAFRGRLRQRELKLRVVKNSIFRRACSEGPLAPLAGHLEGPCALVVGESAIDIAKELADAVKEFPALTLKDGLIEGDHEVTPVAQMSKMMSLGETREHVVLVVLSPARNIAGALQGGAGKVAGCVKTIIEKLEKGETIGSAA
jgi:large subunit ribosomal protein L10